MDNRLMISVAAETLIAGDRGSPTTREPTSAEARRRAHRPAECAVVRSRRADRQPR